MNNKQLELDYKLIIEINNNNYDKTRELIKHGANVNTNININNQIPLLIAINNEDNLDKKNSIVDLLLINKANIYFEISKNQTILDYVIISDKRELLKKLIYFGADINKIKSIIYSVYFDHLHITRILLQNNVDITKVDFFGNTALMLASESEKPNSLLIIKDICTYASNKYINIINYINKSGETALDLASNLEKKDYLISCGAKSFKKLSDKMCDICIYDKINIIIRPCNHGICKLCLSKIHICPFCRGEIKETIKI